MSEELLPCPFCGGWPDLKTQTYEDKHVYYPECVDSECVLYECASTWPTKADALAAWNRRASGWMPIETAPRDGTEVLLTWVDKFGESQVSIGLFHNGRWEDGDFMTWPVDEKSHWQPLPPPPPTTGETE